MINNMHAKDKYITMMFMMMITTITPENMNTIILKT